LTAQITSSAAADFSSLYVFSNRIFSAVVMRGNFWSLQHKQEFIFILMNSLHGFIERFTGCLSGKKFIEPFLQNLFVF
jgi:hypothetical protein